MCLKKLGDGLMALFGYPQAQENDAERAVRAALAIQRALADLNARNARSGAPELSARIGLECGSVVVDAAGEVFGEAPNVAARVQAAAEPGTVLVTASVQRQTAGLFVAEDKGAHELKGVPAPVTLYRIVRASGGGRRGGARDADAAGRPRGRACPAHAPLVARAAKARASSSRSSASPASASRASSRSSAQNSPRRRTPGSNGPPRSSCRTRPCTRSPNGDGCATAAPTRPTGRNSPISRTLCG